MQENDLLNIDKQHIWHPYTSATEPLPTYLVKKASGVRIELADGRQLIDGMASWWCAVHGYNHPALNHAIVEQTEAMAHVMFGGLTHQPAIDLCQRLISLSPAPLQHVFLSDSGSVSVEVAIKMAMQYWNACGKTDKSGLLALRGGYHGDTFAAMSVCDPDTGMHQLFNNTVQQQHFTARPSCRFDADFETQSIQDLEQQIEQHHKKLAAVILEPIVQGAGGMWFYHPNYLKRVRELCDEYDLLLIADEIATGFGRTGKLFACEWADISPDILCVGKALTGGYMSLAATLTTKTVAEGISSQGGVFMHGPTFMGNPLACAVANASLQTLLDQNWQDCIQKLQQQLETELAPARAFDTVQDVRVLGGIGVVEMKEDIDVAKAQAFFVENGVWIRPFGDLLYIMPPYIINENDLSQLCDVMLKAAMIL